MLTRLALLVAIAASSPALGQTAAPVSSPQTTDPGIEEQVVVSASRTEEQLVNTPAAPTAAEVAHSRAGALTTTRACA